MMPKSIVHLLDDEPAMLRALSRLLRAEGFEVRAHSTADAFLRDFSREEIACLVLDVDMPGMSGLELQQQLARGRILLPIIFLTGRGSIPMTVQAIKAGAVDFLTKPVDSADLLRAVESALQKAEAAARRLAGLSALRERAAALTPRERQVMDLVVTGKPNKRIAAELGTGEQNIKIHRGRVMQKMGAESLADLVLAARLLARESRAAPTEKNEAPSVP